MPDNDVVSFTSYFQVDDIGTDSFQQLVRNEDSADVRMRFFFMIEPCGHESTESDD